MRWQSRDEVVVVARAVRREVGGGAGRRAAAAVVARRVRSSMSACGGGRGVEESGVEGERWLRLNGVDGVVVRHRRRVGQHRQAGEHAWRLVL